MPGTFKNNTQLQNIERLRPSLVLGQSMVFISLIWLVIHILWIFFFCGECFYVKYLTFFPLVLFFSCTSVQLESHSHNQFNNEVNPNTD